MRSCTPLMCLGLLGSVSAHAEPPTPPEATPTAEAPTSQPAPEPPKTRWCTISGSMPYRSLEKAQGVAEQARKIGFSDAAVYDTRQFTDLRWGLLSVIAGQFDDQKAAVQAKEKLQGRFIASYVRRCTPSAEAKPIRPEAMTAKAAKLPKRVKISAEMQTGCIAYSPIHQAAACIVGQGGTQVGQHFELAFFNWPQGKGVRLLDSDEQMTPTEFEIPRKMRKGMARQLKAGGFLSWSEIPLVEERDYTLEETSKVVGHHSEEMAGEWETNHHTVTLKCANGKSKVVFEKDVEGSTGLMLTDHLIPREDLIFLHVEMGWGFEGSYGGADEVVVIDLKKVCGK
ncbi:MAG: SPOR domain-containing protein [Bradymonadia bacterium]